MGVPMTDGQRRSIRACADELERIAAAAREQANEGRDVEDVASIDAHVAHLEGLVDQLRSLVR